MTITPQPQFRYDTDGVIKTDIVDKEYSQDVNAGKLLIQSQSGNINYSSLTPYSHAIAGGYTNTRTNFLQDCNNSQTNADSAQASLNEIKALKKTDGKFPTGVLYQENKQIYVTNQEGQNIYIGKIGDQRLTQKQMRTARKNIDAACGSTVSQSYISSMLINDSVIEEYNLADFSNVDEQMKIDITVSGPLCTIKRSGNSFTINGTLKNNIYIKGNQIGNFEDFYDNYLFVGGFNMDTSFNQNFFGIAQESNSVLTWRGITNESWNWYIPQRIWKDSSNKTRSDNGAFYPQIFLKAGIYQNVSFNPIIINLSYVDQHIDQSVLSDDLYQNNASQATPAMQFGFGLYQESTINMLTPCSKKVITDNGITLNVDSQGTIVVNGVASQQFDMDVQQYKFTSSSNSKYIIAQRFIKEYFQGNYYSGVESTVNNCTYLYLKDSSGQKKLWWYIRDRNNITSPFGLQRLSEAGTYTVGIHFIKDDIFEDVRTQFAVIKL